MQNTVFQKRDCEEIKASLSRTADNRDSSRQPIGCLQFLLSALSRVRNSRNEFWTVKESVNIENEPGKRRSLCYLAVIVGLRIN